MLEIRSSIWLCSSCSQRLISQARGSGISTLKRLFSSSAKPGRKQPLKRVHARPFSNSSRASKDIRKSVLPDGPARTRFAPSPTGHLHIGGLRTALFSYLLARRTGGQFLLRIEDTDQKRLVEKAEQRIFDDLRWAGLSWDEGPEVGGPCGPYRQSERTEIYQRHASDLLDRDEAYRCFCVAQTSKEKGQASFVTSGCYQDCSSLSKESSCRRADAGAEQYTVRLKRPQMKRSYPDLVYGKITPLKRSAGSVSAAESDSGIDAADTILIKSDGTPTYHFANVVDDHLMRITHVIRGTEWMASTPLHYDLYHAFGWEPPLFAHVSLLVDEKQAKLSKRNNEMALHVHGMRVENGILPDALCNFIALQGWSNPLDSDVFTLDELIDSFDLKFTRGNTMVRMEKLNYLQKQHILRRCEAVRSTGDSKATDEVVAQMMAEVRSRFPEVEVQYREEVQLAARCQQILLSDTNGYINARQFVERNRYYFSFDFKLVPAVAEYYDKAEQVSGGDVVSSVQRMLENDRCSKPIERADFPERQPDRTAHEAAMGVEESSTRIHAILDNEAWCGALARQRVPSERQDVSTTPHVADPEAYAKTLLGKEASGEAATALVKLKKSWSSGMMRYLRERLAYGTPGPSIGVVMAVLGYQECCRRLGVAPRQDGGW